MQRMQITYVVQVSYKDVRYGAIKLANLFLIMFFFKETKLNINNEGQKVDENTLLQSYTRYTRYNIKYKSE